MNNQFTVVQDFYKSILEKRATDVASSITPDYSKDNREIALREIEHNKADQRKDLGRYLEAAKKEDKADTSAMNKALDAADKSSTDTSNPFVKIAMNKAFFQGLRQVNFIKSASADYMKFIYSAFQDEMSKIAAPLFSMNGPGKMLAGLGKGTAQVAKKPPPIPAAAMQPKAWKPGMTVSGTSLANNSLPVVPGRGVG